MADNEKTPEQLEEERKAAEAAEKDKKKKVKFDEDQQVVVNKLFNEAYKDGAKQAEERLQAQMKAELDRQKAEFEAKLAEAQKQAKTEEKKDETSPELAQLKAQVEEFKNILTGIKTERDALKERLDQADETSRKAKKKDAFLEAMQKAQVAFYEPLEVYELAEKDGYQWDKDTDRPVILNKETGRPRLNESGDPMSVIDFVKDFANRKKYLVKAPAQEQEGGTGAGEQRRHEKNSKDLDFSKMSKEEFEAYRQEVLNRPTARRG